MPYLLWGIGGLIVGAGSTVALSDSVRTTAIIGLLAGGLYIYYKRG